MVLPTRPRVNDHPRVGWFGFVCSTACHARGKNNPNALTVSMVAVLTGGAARFKNNSQKNKYTVVFQIYVQFLSTMRYSQRA